MISITDTTETIRLDIKQKAFYQAKVHGSVGIAVKAEVENEDIIKKSSTKIKYRNKNREQRPGSDTATKTFEFQGLKQGKTKIKIKHVFRGTLKKELIILCEVI